MKKHNSLRMAIVVAALAMGAAGSASAASTYVFGGTSGGLATTGYSTAEAALTISGAYAASGATNTGFASGTNWNTGTAADVLYYANNGLGMASDGNGNPNHAIDNVGNTEAVMLSFSKSVFLNSVGIGFISGDADISVFRYTGTSTPPSLTNVGASLSNMAAAGWALVGNYANLALDTGAPYNLVNTSNLASSYWLVSAYNRSYSVGTPATGLEQGNDYFKIYGVTSTCALGNTGAADTTACKGGSVPEPGSLALIAAGLLGMAGMRRRRNR